LLIHIAHLKDCLSFFFYFPLAGQGYAHIGIKEFGVVLLLLIGMFTVLQDQIQIYYLGTDNAAVINQLSESCPFCLYLLLAKFITPGLNVE